MRVTDHEGAYLPDVDESASSDTLLRRFSVPLILAIAAIALFSAVYPHLIKEARSQGFVLEELAPGMQLLIGWGRRLFWLGGRPLFIPMILTLIAALLILVYSLLKKESRIFSTNRRIILITAAFLLMYLIGGTRNFPLFIVGVAAVPFLGWLSDRGYSEEAVAPSRSSKGETFFLAFALLLGLLLRLYQVDILPRVFFVDEQLFAQVALDLGKHPLQFFSQPHIMKPHLLRIGAIRLAFSTLGVGLLQERTVSALEGTFTVLLVYLLCRKLWGNRAGLFAAFLLAVDSWHIGHSRIAVHDIEGPLSLTVLFLLTIRAVNRGGKRNFALLGAATGLTVYLYLSCLLMAPYMFVMALIGRYVKEKPSYVVILKEAAAMAAAALVVVLPYFTLGRANIGEVENFYQAGGNFLTSARDHGWNPLFALFVNSWSGIDYIADWTSRAVHPAGTVYPNPLAIGLFLIGLGMLVSMRKKFENLLVLLWIPVAWVPVTLSYGFAERRLFAVLVPVPAMLGGLLLAKLWNVAADNPLFIKRTKYLLVTVLLISLILISTFIIYADADPISGGSPHPKKAAEFIGALPPEYKVLISGSLEYDPFLVYLASYDRLQKSDDEEAFSFLPMEVLQAKAEEIATTPRLAIVTGAGRQERELFQQIKALNPGVELFESSEFLACVIGNGPQAQ